MNGRAGMDSLIAGLRSYEQHHRQRYLNHFTALKDGQSPHTLLLTCSDSRIDPALVCGSEPGELFIVRNIANLASTEQPSVASAVWFATQVLGVRDIVVCGHSGCGGMKALLDPPAELRSWLAQADDVVTAFRTSVGDDASLTEVDRLSQLSTRMQLEHLRKHPSVAARLAKGDLALHACWFDIGQARMLAYSETAGRYLPAVEVIG